METNQPEPAAPEQPAVPPRPSPIIAETKTLSEILTRLAQLGIGTIFVLYMMGYLIWFTYLGKFGIAPDTFLQFSFISASLCYLGYVAVFLLPCILFYLSYSIPNEPIQETSHSDKKSNKMSQRQMLIYYWGSVLTLWPLLYLQNDKSSLGMFPAYLLLIGLIHILVRNIYKRRCPAAGLYKLLSLRGWYSFYYLIFCMYYCISSPNINGVYFSITFLGCLVIPPYFRGYWKREDLTHTPFTKVMVLIFLVLATIAHISAFGYLQFSLFPKTVGGGRPDIVYFNLVDTGKNIAPAFNLNATNGFIGPVALLLETDSKLFFISPEGQWNTVTNLSKIHSFSISSSAVNLIQFMHE